MSDETSKCNDHTDKFRLEISGRMPNAAKNSTFVYVSKIENILFDRADMAAGVSRNSDDYFFRKEAVPVEMQ